MEQVLSEPELKKQILKRALEEVGYWQETYKDYQELTRIFSAIKETKRNVLKRIKKKR